MQAKCSYSSTAAMSRVKNSVIRKNQSPCKDCTSRHSGCHSECSLYSDWKSMVSEKTVELLKSYTKTNADVAKRRQTVTI